MLITPKILLDALLSYCGTLTLLISALVVIGTFNAFWMRLSFHEAPVVTLLLRWQRVLTISIIVLAVISVASHHRPMWSVAALLVYALGMTFMAWERWTGKIVRE